MPFVMSLEGPRVDRLAQLRGQLYSAMPRSVHRVGVELNGFFDPFMLNKWWVVAGVIAGAWLAGSAKGQSLVAKVAKR